MFRHLLGLVVALCAGIVFFLAVETLGDHYSGVFLRAGIEALPSQDYTPEIERLKAEKKLEEAFDLADYACRQEDMPGRERACALRRELDGELNTFWGTMGRSVRGFLTGEGTTVAEVSGAVASDMLLYGDLRDLTKQGFRMWAGEDADPVVAALAGFGLATELVDVVDWVPAVLKAFRKLGALSSRFVDFLTGVGARVAKTGRMDDAAKAVIDQIGAVAGKEGLGVARTAAILKNVDTGGELATLAKAVERAPDAAYVLVRSGGKQGLDVLKTVDEFSAGADVLKLAATKGPEGVRRLGALRAGGEYRRLVVVSRYTSRIVKDLRLGRVSGWIRGVMTSLPGAVWGVWAALLGSFWVLSARGIALARWAGRKLRPDRMTFTTRRHLH